MIAARSVQTPPAAAQTPSPGEASTASAVLFTLNVAARDVSVETREAREEGEQAKTRADPHDDLLPDGATGIALGSCPMHVEVRKAKDVVIVDLSGKLLAGVGDEILRNVVNELLAEGWRKILLNLSEVTAIDSAGTGELVESHRICERFGAKLKLLNLHERVRKSLHLSQLLPVFEVYDEERVALRHFEEKKVD